MITVQDIATALKSAIKSWEVTKETNAVQETKPTSVVETPAPVKWTGAVPTYKEPVSKRIFTYVRENQGLTAVDYTQRLSAQGMIASSIGSYICQMLKSKLLFVGADKKIYTHYTEYKTPTQIMPKIKAAKKVKSKLKAKPVTVSVPEKVVVATPAPAVVRTLAVQQKIDSIDQDVEKIMATINLRTAYALFFTLKKMFKE